MERLQLTYFLESARNENFSATAHKYLVPPSTVSAAVKKLENELGVALFDRRANKITLNEQGREFLQAVEGAFALITHAKEKLAAERGGLAGEVRLLVRTERSFVTEKMVAFREHYPDVSFQLTHEYMPTDYNAFDIIIDEQSDKYGGYTQKPLVVEKIRIAAAKTNPLCGKNLTLRDLRNTRFITMTLGSSLHRITKTACRQAGFEPTVVIESDDPFYIRRYVAADFGVAFYPETSWKDAEGAVAFLHVTDFDYSRITCGYLHDSPQTTEIARRFFRFLCEG